jgi:hypothetical protein
MRAALRQQVTVGCLAHHTEAAALVRQVCEARKAALVVGELGRELGACSVLLVGTSGDEGRAALLGEPAVLHAIARGAAVVSEEWALAALDGPLATDDAALAAASALPAAALLAARNGLAASRKALPAIRLALHESLESADRTAARTLLKELGATPLPAKDPQVALLVVAAGESQAGGPRVSLAELCRALAAGTVAQLLKQRPGTGAYAADENRAPGNAGKSTPKATKAAGKPDAAPESVLVSASETEASDSPVPTRGLGARARAKLPAAGAAAAKGNAKATIEPQPSALPAKDDGKSCGKAQEVSAKTKRPAAGCIEPTRATAAALAAAAATATAAAAAATTTATAPGAAPATVTAPSLATATSTATTTTTAKSGARNRAGATKHSASTGASRGPIVIATSGLPDEETGDLAAMVKLIGRGAKLAEDDGHGGLACTASHVVVASLEEPKRTLKVLAAIARGAWVVRSNWLYASLEARKWVDEAEHEVDAARFPGARAMRAAAAAAAPGLLSSRAFYIAGATRPKPEDLATIVKLAGGRVTKRDTEADIVLASEAHLRGLKGKVPHNTVSETWLFDCIVAGRLDMPAAAPEEAAPAAPAAKLAQTAQTAQAAGEGKRESTRKRGSTGKRESAGKRESTGKRESSRPRSLEGVLESSPPSRKRASGAVASAASSISSAKSRRRLLGSPTKSSEEDGALSPDI